MLVEQAIETAALMLGSDKSSGYRLEHAERTETLISCEPSGDNAEALAD